MSGLVSLPQLVATGREDLLRVICLALRNGLLVKKVRLRHLDSYSARCATRSGILKSAVGIFFLTVYGESIVYMTPSWVRDIPATKSLYRYSALFSHCPARPFPLHISLVVLCPYNLVWNCFAAMGRNFQWTTQPCMMECLKLELDLQTNSGCTGTCTWNLTFDRRPCANVFGV